MCRTSAIILWNTAAIINFLITWRLCHFFLADSKTENVFRFRTLTEIKRHPRSDAGSQSLESGKADVSRSSGCRSEVKMRVKFPVLFFAILLAALSVSAQEQNNLSVGRERLAQPDLKNYSDPNIKVEYQLEKTVMDQINRQRAQDGLSLLVWNEKAARIARLHSENMAHYKFFNHRGLDGMMVNDRADEVNLDWNAIGENIAFNRGYDNPVEFTVDRWMHSESHKENILDKRWKETGIGVVLTNDGTYYLTQVFLKQ
jgi:uncharacterized protein YkwD